jgi:hypothetical protein
LNYFKVETKILPSTGTTTVTKIKLDANTYSSVTESQTDYSLVDGTQLKIVITKETQTYYEYEQEINEKKRLISILKPEFVTEIESELISIMKDTIT